MVSDFETMIDYITTQKLATVVLLSETYDSR